MTIVSYSEISKFQTCKRQYYYNFILGLQPVVMSDAISMGIKGHKLLQDFYILMSEGMDKLDALEHIREKAKKQIHASVATDFALLTAWTLVDNYIRDNDFTSEAILVENRFLIPASTFTDDPFFEDVQIGFTPDVVFKRKSGFIDVEDAKFVARAWSKKRLNRNSQVKLYQVFLESMGFDISRSILRFFNVKTGTITIEPYVMKPEEKKTVIHDFLEGVRDTINFKTQTMEKLQKAPRTMNDTACQFCYFEFVCSLEAEGKNATKTFNAEYVKRNYDYSK
jgi:CRISPR/Cas system-associated exonuclease Cas4 (RecB family)